MPQATVDLPDPTDPPIADAPAGATDDLLSQLAGDEIDRLLADAGVEPEAEPQSATPATPTSAATSLAVTTSAAPTPVVPTPASAAVTPAATPAAANPAAKLPAVAAAPPALLPDLPATASTIAPAKPADPTIAKELDQVFERQLSEATGTGPVSPTPAATNPDESIAGGVSDLLDRLESGERMPTPGNEPVTAPSDIAPTAAAALAAPATPAAPTAPSNELPKEVVAAVASVAAASSASPDVPPATPPAADEPPIQVELKPGPAGPSIVSRVLDVVTVPLDPFPDRVRDAIGKVAIVTTLNAIAILVYVLFFKK